MGWEFADVGQFHRKFGLATTDVDYYPPNEVRDLPEDLIDFRVKFMEEELQEFKDARAAGDEAGMFDALIDLCYVAMGTAHLKNYPWVDGWVRVQHANMAKVRATKETASDRGGIWDVVKPKGWVPPDIAGLIS